MIPPQAFGGNMDNKLLTAGSKLFLPVQAEGALFSAGDPHAAQGDGESGELELKRAPRRHCGSASSKIGKFATREPMVSIDSKPYLLAMGVSEDLYIASQIAMEGMIDELGQTWNIWWRRIHSVQPRGRFAHLRNRGRSQPASCPWSSRWIYSTETRIPAK